MHLRWRSRALLLLLQLDRRYPPLVRHPSQRLSLLAPLARLLHGRTTWRRCSSSFASPSTSCRRMALSPPMDQATEITLPRRAGIKRRPKRRNPSRKLGKRIAARPHAPLPFKAGPSSPDLARRPHLKRCHPACPDPRGESNEGPAVSARL